MAREKQSTIFRGIDELYTFEALAKKQGRHARAEDLVAIRDAAIIARAGRIEWIGPLKKMPRIKGARTVDLGKATVIPALIECHTHLIHAGNRAGEFERRNQGESYQSIAESGGGILSTVRATRAASAPVLTKLGQERIERFIQQGVTTVEVKSGYALETAGELKMLKAAKALKRARVVPTFLGAHAIPKEHASAEAYVDYLTREAFPKLKGLAKRADIFVEKGYFSSELGRRYFEAAKKYGIEAVVHADQLTRSGGSELAVAVDARSADHLICIDPGDVKRLAASDVTCVLLPSADLYMKCPYPPARALIDAGARVALATDFNPGTAPSQDLALVGILARIEMKMSLPEVYSAYTVGAAHALGLEADLGSLETGKFCDFAVLDGGLEELFLEVGRQPVRSVYREALRLL